MFLDEAQRTAGFPMISKGLVGSVLGSGIVRSISLLASATAFGQALLLAAMPFLTRIYTPQEFGIFAIFSGFTAPILVISSLRYEFAIPLPRSDTSARSLMILSLVLNTAVAAFALGILMGWRESVASYFGAPELSNLLLILPLIVFGGGAYKALNYWAIRKTDFRLIARTRIDQSVSNVATQIAAGLAGWGVYGLVLGQFFGFAAGTVRLARGAHLTVSDCTKREIRARILPLARLHARFPRYDVPAALINVIGVQLPNITLAALFSAPVAGFYMVAERVLSAPLSLVGQAIGQVLLSESRDGARSGTLVSTALRIALGLTMLSVVPAVVLFFAGEWLFSVIFGETWREAGVYASWMALGLFVQFIYSSISVVLMATEGQHINFFIHTALLIAKVAALYFGAIAGDPLMSVIGIAVANFVGYGFAIFVVILHARRYAAGHRQA